MLLLCGAFDQGLGIVESLVLMVSVGLMLDPITHVAFAFSEARGTPEERLASALSVIGISVLASCVSTAGSCAVMAVATIVLFSRFALLGELNPEFKEQSDAFLESMGMDSADVFREVLGEAHTLLRQDAEREREQ